MQTAQQLHKELVLYPAGAVPKESWLALGACPQQQFELQSGVHFKGCQRTSPPHPTFCSLVCMPVLSQHVKLNWKTTFRSTNCTGLHRTNGHTVHRPGLLLTCSKEPKHAAWSDGQPGQSLHRLLGV